MNTQARKVSLIDLMINDLRDQIVRVARNHDAMSQQIDRLLADMAQYGMAMQQAAEVLDRALRTGNPITKEAGNESLILILQRYSMRVFSQLDGRLKASAGQPQTEQTK